MIRHLFKTSLALFILAAPSAFAQGIGGSGGSGGNGGIYNFSPTGTGAFSLNSFASAAAPSGGCWQIKGAPGVLYNARGVTIADGQYVMFIAGGPTPVSGAVLPMEWVWVPTAGNWSLDEGVFGKSFTGGLYVCLSSGAVTAQYTFTPYSTGGALAVGYE